MLEILKMVFDIAQIILDVVVIALLYKFIKEKNK